MTMFADAGAEAPRRSAVRALPVTLVMCLSLAIGVISEFGSPGSVIALPLGAIALLLLAACRRASVPLLRTGLAPATLVSWIAVLIQPSLLALSLHWFCLVSLAIAVHRIEITHIADSEAIADWLASLLRTPVAMMRDLGLVRGMRDMAQRHPGLLALSNLVLPVIAFGVFATLLVIANPMMESLVQGRFDRIFTGWILPATFFALALLTTVNSARPAHWHPSWDRELPDTHWRFNFVNPTSLTTTLVLLNGLFTVQNLFDFKYVWLAGELPPGMTHAEYVHRGSYTLIATAILAALLIVLALRKGSATEASRYVRQLVYLWLAQNVFLVASSAARTLAYVDDYGMSLWRLSGLIWMGVVAGGLLLVAIRVLSRRGNEWLTNANLAVCLVVLLGCAMTDLRWIVAEWNAEAAIAKPAKPVDVGYLRSLGPSALPALVMLQSRGIDAGLRCETNPLNYLFRLTPVPEISGPLSKGQSHWQSYTLLGEHYQAVLDEFIAACHAQSPQLAR